MRRIGVRARVSHVGLLGVAAVLGACGGPVPSPPVAAPKPPAVATPAAPAPPPVATAPELPKLEIPSYEPRGRRDPFASLEAREGTGGLTVASTKLTGIVRGDRTPLVLVEASDGIGYILKPGDTLGDGRLLEIGSDSAVFSVTPKPGAPSDRVVLKLAAN